MRFLKSIVVLAAVGLTMARQNPANDSCTAPSPNR